jgi:thiamine-phosphate pyrophosphorylase
MKNNVDYSLYLVTDSGLMVSKTIEECVEQAILGGCTLIQLRESKANSLEFYQKAVSLREVTARLGVPLIINNRVDIALAVRAEGVHIGQDDLPYEAARKILGPDKLIGVSCSNVIEAKEAEKLGADYIGVGAIFATNTKSDARPITPQGLKEIRGAVSIPIVAIGGINENNINLLKDTGFDGVAVVSAIVAQQDVAMAAKKMKNLVASIKK